MIAILAVGIPLLIAASVGAFQGRELPNWYPIPIMTVFLAVVAAGYAATKLLNYYNPAVAALMDIRACFYGLPLDVADSSAAKGRSITPRYIGRRSTQRRISRLIQGLPAYVWRDAAPLFPRLSLARTLTAVEISENIEIRTLTSAERPLSTSARKDLARSILAAVDLITYRHATTDSTDLTDYQVKVLQNISHREGRLRALVRGVLFTVLIIVPILGGATYLTIINELDWDAPVWADSAIRWSSIAVPVLSIVVSIVRRRASGRTSTSDEITQAVTYLQAAVAKQQARQGASE